MWMSVKLKEKLVVPS